MKMKRRITWEFYNSFTEESLGSIGFTYCRLKAVEGKYSRMWKKWRLMLANEYRVEKRFVRMNIVKS